MSTRISHLWGSRRSDNPHDLIDANLNTYFFIHRLAENAPLRSMLPHFQFSQDNKSSNIIIFIHLACIGHNVIVEIFSLEIVH